MLVMTIQAVPRHAYRVLVAAGGACTVLTAVLAFTLEHPYGSTVVQAWAWGAVAPLYLVGLLAVIVRPDHLSARWLGAAGSLIAIETAGRRLLPQLGDLNAGWWLANATFLQVAILATAASIASVLVVFPDDHYRYRYQKRVLLAIWLFVAVVPATLLVSRPSLHFFPSWAGPDVVNPVYVAFLAPLGGVAEVAYNWRVVLWAAGAAAMVVRYRRASPGARRQFRWPLAAAVTLTLLDTTYRSLEQLERLPAALGTRLVFFGLVPGLVLLSVSILAALARHRLIGIELWLRRLILFGGASTVIALAYLGLAGSAGWAAGQQLSVGVGVVVTLAAVVAFYPARRRLDAWARHRVFGPSVAGTDVLRRVGDALEDAHDVRHLGSNLVRTVVDGLDLEWSRLSPPSTGSGPSYPVAASGVGHDDTVVPDLVVPLTSGDETVGYLECGPKREGELTTADEALVATVARQAALAVRNVRLGSELESRLDELHRQAEELTTSRSRLLHAQMEERHRIERNIHDGVQQEIIASIAKVRLARNQLARDRELAETTLAGLQDDYCRMLDNLRELSRGIHPSVLTHRGLVEALRTQATLLPIDVHVDVAAELRNARFGAEVEEAAYYVVSEGLTNVLKHAHTDEATVQLAIDDGQLTVQVIDHGRGCISGPAPGSGIIGLRDRLGPIGGELRLDGRPGDGTTLRATLPIQVAERHG
jgi:signal transduction histidine kinase